MRSPLARRAVAEGLGTALLLAAVVGSGIMGDRLAGGNTAIALLANSIATGAALSVLILTFGPLSGAHFNPCVTLAFAGRGEFPWSEVPIYIAFQMMGAFFGTGLADAMFGLPWFAASTHVRGGGPALLSEVVATFGLLAVIWSCARHHPKQAPFAVGAYIASAYWFTASTSFANPAVTVARAWTESFAGIHSASVVPFVFAQLLGATLGTMAMAWLMPTPSASHHVLQQARGD